jgi:hypothetical protein
MTDWDGTRWIPADSPRARAPRRGIRRRLLGASTEAALITLLMFGLVASTTLAARGGGGNEPSGPTTCAVEGNVVSAAGLPMDQVINLMVTDAHGTWGWALGFAGDEAWGISVPDRSGPTTYEFASRTWGKGGSKYSVFSRCYADG